MSSYLRLGAIRMDAELYKAAEQGDSKFLNSSSADLGLQLTPKKNTVLHIAAQFGQADCINWILEQHSCFSLLRQPNLKGDTPLQVAARGGHLKAVQTLIDIAAKERPREMEGGVEADEAVVRMANNEGDTALHEAVRFHHPEVVKFLIEKDASLTTVVNNCGETPLYIAAELGFQELVKIIIEDTSKWNISPAHTGIKGGTALHAAVIGNNKEIVKQMLQWKPDLAKEVDENGWSSLHYAAYLGHNLVMKELLDRREKSVVDLRVKNDDRKTALHIAASRGHLTIVSLLVSHYPDCWEQVDEKGNNAIHLLAPRMYLFTLWRLPLPWFNLQELLTEKNDEGKTPLHLVSGFIVCYSLHLLATVDFAAEKIPFLSMWRNVKARSAWQKMAEGDEISSTSESKERDEQISEIKKASENHLLVAALIATVTFAAGFTLPGGYIQSGAENQGMAVLAATDHTVDNNRLASQFNRSNVASNRLFLAFIYGDAIALMLSMMAVTLYFLMALYNNNKQTLRRLFSSAYCLTLLSICATVFAFLSGMLAVLRPSTFLETSMTIGTIFFLVGFATLLGFYSPPINNASLIDEAAFFYQYFAVCILAYVAWVIISVAYLM